MVIDRKRKVLTVEEVRKALDYDPETGVLRWKYREDRSKAWNVHFAGKEAGCIQARSDGKQYRAVRLNDVLCVAHQIIWLWVHGEWAEAGIDHRDGFGLHNWIDNLRKATQAQNTQNRGAQRNSSTGIKGIGRHGSRWRARITGHGVTQEKTFRTLAEAMRWYRDMTVFLHGEFANHDNWTDKDIETLSQTLVIEPKPRMQGPITADTLSKKNARPQSNNKCGVRGVYKHASGVWRARIKANGVEHDLGCHRTLEEATAARKEGERLYHKQS